jgi:alpha-D-ribose 1-methylphosphonate 5-triphosphate synthase subunit PhnG
MTDRALTTEQRAELLAAADPSAVVELAEACLAVHGDPVVVQAPEVGLVMLQVREPVCEERFHLGEVVVTRAEVVLAGARGWALRAGTDRTAALGAAVCDAVAASGAELAWDVIELCLATQRSSAAAAAEEWRELLATEVHFEELD